MLYSHNIFSMCPISCFHLCKYQQICKYQLILYASGDARMNRTYSVPASQNLESSRGNRKRARNYKKVLRGAVTV